MYIVLSSALQGTTRQVYGISPSSITLPLHTTMMPPSAGGTFILFVLCSHVLRVEAVNYKIGERGVGYQRFRQGCISGAINNDGTFRERSITPVNFGVERWNKVTGYKTIHFNLEYSTAINVEDQSKRKEWEMNKSERINVAVCDLIRRGVVAVILSSTTTDLDVDLVASMCDQFNIPCISLTPPNKVQGKKTLTSFSVLCKPRTFLAPNTLTKISVQKVCTNEHREWVS